MAFLAILGVIIVSWMMELKAKEERAKVVALLTVVTNEIGRNLQVLEVRIRVLEGQG